MVNARIQAYHTLLSTFAQARLLAGGSLSPQVTGKWKKRLHVAWEGLSPEERAVVASALRMPGDRPRSATASPGMKAKLRLVHSAPTVVEKKASK